MLQLLRDLREDEITSFYFEKLTDNLSDLLGDDFKFLKSKIDYNSQCKILSLTFHYGNLSKSDEIIRIFEDAFNSVERLSTSFGLKLFYTKKGAEQDTEYWYSFVSDIDVYVDLVY